MSGAERFLIHNLQPPLLGKRREDRNSKAEGVVVREVSLARSQQYRRYSHFNNISNCHTGMQVYDSVDSIKWSRPKGRLYILAKRGSRDLRKLLWMPPLPTPFKALILASLPSL